VTGSVIQPGDLNRRLALEAPMETPDGAGGVTRSYEAVATVWAQVTPVAARADVAADSLVALVTHRIVIRAGQSLTTQHRLREGARIFRIVAYRDSGGRRFLDIDAQEQKD
jgi:SPP1 family predicted phage head-tail adaptor